MNRTYATILSSLLLLMITIIPVFVAGSHITGHDDGAPIEITNPLTGVNSLKDFVVKALRVVRDIAFLVAIFFIVYAGYLFVTAQGNDDKLKKAKSAFLWAIVGTAVILGAEIFARVLQGTVQQIGG